MKRNLIVIFMLVMAIVMDKTDSAAQKLTFPRAFAFAIDDMGWNNGGDLSSQQGPWRDGVNKHMTLSDYQAVVNVGKAVGARVQGLFVLCEMDRQNICGKYPTTTMYGSDWNNSANVNDDQMTIMNFVRDNAAHLEFSIHGIAHEYWPSKGKRVRAEWYNLTDNAPWPEDSLLNHLKCFQEIMSQYGLNAENGHSFPESFVPGMYGYYWNPSGDYSMGKLLHEYGVRFANTKFSFISAQNPPIGDNAGGFDHGILAINRLNYGNSWDQFGALPSTALNNQKSDIIESHWPNWQSANANGQEAVTNKWIAYYKSVQNNPNRYIAKNTEQLYSQWLYNRYTKVQEGVSGTVTIDNSSMADDAYSNNLLSNMVLKIKLDPDEHISSALIDQNPIAAYCEDQGYAFIYLPKLEKRIYTLVYTVGQNSLTQGVFNDGTYTIYSFKADSSTVSIDLKMYGTQTVKIKTAKPIAVKSSNANLKINSTIYDESTGVLSLEIYGRDFQGERGIVTINNSTVSTNIVKPATKFSFSLYPNPTKDFLNINAINVSGHYRCTISAITGQIIYNQAVMSRNNQIAEQINVSKIKSGVYIVRLMNNEDTCEKLISIE